jgi:hypothetical protein
MDEAKFITQARNTLRQTPVSLLIYVCIIVILSLYSIPPASYLEWTPFIGVFILISRIIAWKTRQQQWTFVGLIVMLVANRLLRDFCTHKAFQGHPTVAYAQGMLCSLAFCDLLALLLKPWIYRFYKLN